MSESRFSCSVRAGIFNSNQSHVWGEANTDTAFCHCQQKCFLFNVWPVTVHDFLIGSYLLPPWLSALGVSGGNATRIAGENPLGTQEIHVIPAWWGCGSFSMSGPETSHCHLKWLLDWIGWTCGFLYQVTGPHTTELPLMGLHKKKKTIPWVTYRQLILKNICCLLSLRQQHPSGRRLAILSTHDNLCFIDVGFVLRLVAIHQIMCSKLVIIQLCSKYFSSFAWFPTLVRPT